MTGITRPMAGIAGRAQLPVPRMVLMHILRESGGRPEILMGVKKRGFGMGKVIAPGGRIEAGETPLEAAVRETSEETGLIVPPSAAELCALLDFQFPHRPDFSTVVAVFRTWEFGGEVTGSDELDGRWFAVGELPLGQMWDDDAYWLERTLAGERLYGVFSYGPDNETVERCELFPLPPA